MDVKVLCPCGAKYEFPVEPVAGRLPCPIACPVCGADNTQLGNAVIAEKLGRPADPLPGIPLAQPAGLRINTPPAAAPAPPPMAHPRPIAPISINTRPASGSSSRKLKAAGATFLSVALICFGLYAIYAKWSKRVGSISNLISAFSEDGASGPDIDWVLPLDDGCTILVKSGNHTNVAQAFASAYNELTKQQLTIVHAKTDEFDEDSRFAVYPAYKDSVEIFGPMEWQEPQFSSLGISLSKQLSTTVVTAAMGDDADSGEVCIYQNGERKFRLKRWYRITSLSSEDGIKEFMEREGEDWATPLGYVPSPQKVLTGDTDEMPFEDVNNLLLKLGFATSDEEEIKNVLLLK